MSVAVLNFNSAKHQEFYEEMLGKVKKDDCYHRAFFYVVGLSDDARRHIDNLFDFEEDGIIPEGLQDGWQTGGSIRVCRMAFNLWNGYVEEGAEAETTPESLFASPLSPYFAQGLRLRYPEYFREEGSDAEW